MSHTQCFSRAPCDVRRRRRQRTALNQAACIAVSLLMSLAIAIPKASALGCREALDSADRDRNLRLDRSEYITVVNSLSEGAFHEASSLHHLPDVLQETFDQLSCQCIDDGPCCESVSINFGTEPSRIHSDNQVCNDIKTSIHRALEYYAPIQAPVLEPRSSYLRQADVSSRQVNVTFTQCMLAVGTANTNKDSFLNQNEYVKFVNELSGDAFSGETLGTVPVEIRSNFFQLRSDNGQIDISGFREPTDEQRANLEQICDSTVAAINEALGFPSGPTAAPTPAVTGPTASPVLTTAKCYQEMGAADTNNDNLLNQAEYFTFVSPRCQIEGRGRGGALANHRELTSQSLTGRESHGVAPRPQKKSAAGH